MFGDYFMREHDFFANPVKSLSDNYVNGMDAMVMQSASDVDKVIALFENAIEQSYHPNEVEQEVYRQANVNPSDFTWYDKQKIQRKVEEIYKSKGNRY